MTRRLAILAAAGGFAAYTGCASTWDKVSSRKFREAPFHSTFSADDPMTVLRTRVEGSDRADAMRGLKEPLADGRPETEQDESLQILGTAATSDPSPVVRSAAIDALGRFQDPRAVKILIAAYHKADGVGADPHSANAVQQASAFSRADSTDPLSLLGPVGFEPVFVTTLRSRVMESLAKTNSSEAVTFLGSVASSPPSDKADSVPVERDVRSAAVRGLGKMRNPEAVAALTRVLKDEAGRDVVLASNAHAGLKELTGKNLPADPDQWAQVVQTGVDISPEPNAIQRAVGWIGR